MEVNLEQVGLRIKNIRTKLGLNMREFGELIGDTERGAIGNWERGRNLPNKERTKRIAEIGGISTNQLLYGSMEEYAYKVLMTELEEDSAFLNVVKQYLVEQGTLATVEDEGADNKAIQQVSTSFKDIYMKFLMLRANSPDSPKADLYNYPNTIIRMATKFFSTAENATFTDYYANLMKQVEGMELKRSAGSIEDIQQRLINRGMDAEEAYREATDRYYSTKVAQTLKELEFELNDIYTEYSATV